MVALIVNDSVTVIVNYSVTVIVNDSVTVIGPFLSWVPISLIHPSDYRELQVKLLLQSTLLLESDDQNQRPTSQRCRSIYFGCRSGRPLIGSKVMEVGGTR